MSHALLLRLFLSPSFFSVHVALRYLMLYHDNIGITYYLTRRLREFTIDELRDVWGFVCYLLVSRPSKSRALECFVTEIARKSTHIAMHTLWFMQASLKDLSDPSRNPESFHICQRTLLMCHELIFGDLPPPATTPYPSLMPSSQPRFFRKKVKPNAFPALVGMGSVLAGVPGLPVVTEIMGEIAVEQGRVDDQDNDLKSLERSEDNAEGSSNALPHAQQAVDEEDGDSDDYSESEKSPNAEDSALQRQAVFPGGLDANGQPIVPRKSRRRTIGAAQTSPALPLHLRKSRQPRFSDDPLGQLDPPRPAPSPAAFQSSPSLSSSYQPHRTNSANAADVLLSRYDLQSQVHLLRSHFCRSEIQFLLNLESIAQRLLVVPRPARVSALRAELTVLNHKLPAEICMPMWCTSTDALQPPHDIPTPHHKIVRVPPGECVVLNSAQHAPYLLLIEILNGELDFDPSKRSNKAILQKIVAKENERKGASRDLIPFTTSSSHNRHRPPELVNGTDAAFGKEATEDSPELQSPSDTDLQSAQPPAEEEEIDLVEQLYGTEESLRTIDISDSIVLPPAPKNKDLDMATWSRASSIPPSPAIDQLNTSINPFANSSPAMHRSSSSHSQSQFSTPQLGTNSPSLAGKALSLEDYSERMRTAAVMLAQLNANLVWEPTAGPSSEPSGPLGWLPGSNWFSIGPPPATPHGGPLHPSLTGPSHDNSGSSSANQPARMKLQPSEAAAIRDRIMKEMLALEEERMERMRENRESEAVIKMGIGVGDASLMEDEGIIRRELNKEDPSAVVFSESWAAKKSRVRQGSPYGHLASWDCLSVIVKTGDDLRQEQLAVQLIQEFKRIFQEENCQCWVRYFRILITGGSSGLVETITDAVSIHSIKKAEYARRLAEGRLGHVSLMDHFKNTYGSPSSARFARAQRNFAKSLAGYSIVTYLLQIKDRHNGNILLDREGHLIHIDFGFMLSNSPGNIGFEASPFKLPLEYVEVLGGVNGEPLREFRRLFREGFEAARKHCDRIITMVELMQKDSTLPCFAAFGEQTAVQLRERFQQALTHSLVAEHVDKLIDTSLGSHWTRLYDSYQYYSQSILS
ncbi:kinase-like protein [Dentipellis sp. KUC8613]|nr:kinase-like protein [Dentipellis sp. KUC8613]